MLLLNWLNYVWSRSRRRGDRPLPKERRLRLMRLEQRRVLNADFTFTPHVDLTLSHVDADLTVRETDMGQIEFHLSAGSWNGAAGSGAVVSPDGSTLSLSVANFDLLSTASITAQNATHNILLDASTHDLHLADGSLTIQDFGNVSQLGTNSVQLANATHLDATVVSFAGPLTVGDLTVVNADDVNFDKPVEAFGTIDITTTGSLGNVRFSDTVTTHTGSLIVDATGETGLDATTNIDGNVDIDTVTLDLNGNINTTSDGTVTVTNSGDAELGVGLKITSEGSVLFDGIGAINLNADIKTTDAGSDITVETSEVRVFGDRTLTANGDITLAEVLTTTPDMHSLTLHADPDNLLSDSGDVTLNGKVAVDVVNIVAGGRIIDGEAGTAIDVQAKEALLSAAEGIGGPGANATLEVDVGLLDLDNSVSGGVFLSQDGDLTLHDLNGVEATLSGNDGQITAHGQLLIDMDMTIKGTHTFTADGAATDNLIINTDATVTLASTVDKTLTFESVSGAIIGNTKPEGDMNPDIAGGAGTIVLKAVTGITLETDIDAVSATNQTSGNIELSERGDLNVLSLDNKAASGVIQLTANTITVSGDIRAIDGDPATPERIEINARGDFNLLSGHVITTDDAPEKLRTTGDVIQITADSDHDSVGGQVFLGTGTTISTDAGILQQIAPRPAEGVAGTAFFDFTSIVTSNLMSNGLDAGGVKYLGFLTVTIGVPGEKNLILDVDWGDTSLAMFTALQAAKAQDILTDSNTNAPQAGTGGQLAFDSTVDKFKTRFFIPEGGVTYIIPHEYSSAALNMPVELGEPGRLVSSDPFQVRFSVSEHPSVLILGRAVFDPSSSDTPAGTAQVVTASAAFSPLANLSSTDSLDNPIVQEPRLDTGATAFTIPTTSAPPVIRIEPPIPPPELPKPAIQDVVVIVPPILTTEVSSSAAVSSAVTTSEYFELRMLNEDGTTSVERLSDSQGEELLQKREALEKFVAEKGDGEYEIWFVTKDNRGGATIERPVIQFRLEGGSLAPPTDDLPKLFKPFRLIPQTDAPEKAPEKNEGNAEAAGNSDSSAVVSELKIVEEISPDERQPDDGTTKTDEMSAIDGASLGSDTHVLNSGTDDQSVSSLSAVAGVVVLAGAGQWKRRRGESKTTLFSQAARLSRKWVGDTQDR